MPALENLVKKISQTKEEQLLLPTKEVKAAAAELMHRINALPFKDYQEGAIALLHWLHEKEKR